MRVRVVVAVAVMRVRVRVWVRRASARGAARLACLRRPPPFRVGRFHRSTYRGSARAYGRRRHASWKSSCRDCRRRATKRAMPSKGRRRPAAGPTERPLSSAYRKEHPLVRCSAAAPPRGCGRANRAAAAPAAEPARTKRRGTPPRAFRRRSCRLPPPRAAAAARASGAAPLLPHSREWPSLLAS